MTRPSILAVFIVAICQSPASSMAGPWPIDESDVPEVIVLSPGPLLSQNPIGRYTVTILGPLGPVNGAFVEVEVSPDADALVSWCAAPFGGPSGQTHPIVSGMTDSNGQITFHFYGGGCVSPDEFHGATFIAQVRSDGVVMGEPWINSPDAVDASGLRATDPVSGGGQKRCDTVEGTEVAQVSLADAVSHTRPVKEALLSACTKFTPPFNAHVSVSDAVLLTPYIRTGAHCACQ